jgi:hypothetical protein
MPPLLARSHPPLLARYRPTCRCCGPSRCCELRDGGGRGALVRGGGGGRRRGERERRAGEMGSRASARGPTGGTSEAFCGMDSTELTCEARFELPNPAWPRGLICMRWAVLRRPEPA